MQHSNTAVTVKFVLDACKEVGLEPLPILDKAGITAEVAYDPDGQVTMDQMQEFWRVVFKASGDPDLAFRAAQQALKGEAPFRTVEFLLESAPTFGEGITSFVRYFSTINTWLYFEIELKLEEVEIIINSVLPLMPIQPVQFGFALISGRCRQIIGQEWKPLRVEFHFSPPADLSMYQEIFSCPLHFNMDKSRLVFTRKTWASVNVNAKAELFSILNEHGRMLLAEKPQPEDFIGAVKIAIRKELASGKFGRNQIANQMALSGRSLQRKLAALDCSFAELLDQTRQEMAKMYLQQDKISLTETSFLLGFNEQSSFSRSFKRWCGITPYQYRLQMQKIF